MDNVKKRQTAAKRREKLWTAKWARWKAIMRVKYGSAWRPLAGCDTWRKWRARRLIRLSAECIAARKIRDLAER